MKLVVQRKCRLMTAVNGFWLPREVRQAILSDDTHYDSASFKKGSPCDPSEPMAITARWPRLSVDQWQRLVGMLKSARRFSPTGLEYWQRLGLALQTAGKRLTVAGDPVIDLILDAISHYTGYSRAMIQLTTHALDLISLEEMVHAYTIPTGQLPEQFWMSMDALPGMMIFTPTNRFGRPARRVPFIQSRKVFNDPQVPGFVLGYGAGNVPGTALLIALLAGSTTLAGDSPPAVLVRNSRREPIFSPFVLSEIEEVDSELVAATAVLVWDYGDRALQERLLAESDLVIAAASDETIREIGAQITIANTSRDRRAGIRYHQHGHKVSFSAISKDALKKELTCLDGAQPFIDILAYLAGLDSVYWDQYGCLSARMHFIEEGGEGYYSAGEYAGSLCQQLRTLGAMLPRGAAPLRLVRDSFDRYKLLEQRGKVQVVSDYRDDFLLVIDRRQVAREEFFATVNSCSGRVIIVRPVADLMEFPEGYLSLIPPHNLQSLSVAFGSGALTERHLQFAKACARRGVTAIRTLGRGAFPQLAYSWDGLVPLDLVSERPAGYFTSIEFDDPVEQIMNTYERFIKMGVSIGGA